MRRLLPILISFVFFTSLSASATSVVNDGYVLLNKDELEQIFDPALLYLFATGDLREVAAQAQAQAPYYRHCDEFTLPVRPDGLAHQRLQEAMRAHLNNSDVHIVEIELKIYAYCPTSCQFPSQSS